MTKIQFIKSVMQVKSGRALLQERCAFPQISHTSQYCMRSVKNKVKTQENDYLDEFDKPIKFSTSKAAKFPAAYTEALGIPRYQGVIVSLSLSMLFLYFGVLREENDIDEKMVQNIPTEILEQIYGKENMKPKTRLN